VALREIQRYQSSTELLIPKAPFRRLVREVMLDVAAPNSYRIQAFAFGAIQEFIEGQMINLFECKYSNISMPCNHHVTISSVPSAVYSREACYIAKQGRQGFAADPYFKQFSYRLHYQELSSKENGLYSNYPCRRHISAGTGPG
jgi:histone H3/H4